MFGLSSNVENYNIMRYKFTLLVVLVCICSVWAEAKVKLPSVLSDGMVLQRERPIKIWGTAEPGEDVVVTFKRKKYTAKTDENGRWVVILPAMKAGGPYEMTVNEVIVKDILVGDEKNKKSTAGTVSYMPAVFGCYLAEYVIRRI